MTIDEKYKEVAQAISGGAVSDLLVDIIKELVQEDQLDLLLTFKKSKSQSIDQLKESSGLSEKEILEKTSALAKKGVIFNQPNSAGVLVFRLLPLANVGIFEYNFMKKLTYTEEEKRIAALFTKLFSEVQKITPEKWAEIIQMFPPPDRTVPIRTNMATNKPTVIEINEEVAKDAADRILLTGDVKDLIEKFDEIAVGHCFCRQHKDTESKHCRQTNLRETCFTFGKSARFTTENGFMRMIDKKEALKILSRAEEDGLVHKAYHPNFDITKEETSICNCCKDCCGNSTRFVVNISTYLSHVDADLCHGCQTCAIRCHTDAIKLGEDGVSHVDPERCIGCGVCAHFCPVNAINLTKTPPRTVRVVVTRPD
jgi:ferredoxin